MARRRHRGDGSVFYSRTERVWIARVSLGCRDGKRIRRKVRARTELGARQELERLQRAYRAGGSPASGTLDQYLRDWLPAQRHLRDSTARSYEGHVRLHISPLLGGIRLADLRASDVRRLIASLEANGKRPGTIHLVIRTLSAALNDAVHERVVPDNATDGVRLPRLEREPVRPLTAIEADAILDAVRGHWLEPLVRLLLGSGLRLGEALGLDQGDLMLDVGFVRVRRSKTSIRAVPITLGAVDALRDALAVAPRRGPGEPVFFGPRRGDRLRGGSVSHALPRLLGGVGIGRVHPHLLRHGAATLMLADGVPMRVIAEQLGHRNPAITARVYAHVIPEAQRAAIGSLERKRTV